MILFLWRKKHLNEKKNYQIEIVNTNNNVFYDQNVAK
jgi:hypothetical protein